MTAIDLFNIAGFIVALIAIGTVVYQAGKSGEKLQRHEKHIHDLRNEINILPAKYIAKDRCQLEHESVKYRLDSIDRILSGHSKMLNKIMIMLARAQGKEDTIDKMNNSEDEEDDNK